MSANPFAALGFGSDSEDEGAPKVAAPKAKVAEVKKADAKPAATNARAKSAPAKKDSGREASDPDTARKTDTRARDANKRGAAENREKRNRDRAPREDGEKAPRAPRAPRDGEKNMDRHSRRGPSDQKREQRGGEGKGNWGSAKDTVVPAADDAAADAAEAPVATPVEPEAPAPKEFSYEEYMSMKKVRASLPELPKARAAGEGDKGAVPMGTAITRKEKEAPVVIAERKLAQKEKAEIVFGVKSYSSTQREERPERPASRERGAPRGAARGGARGAPRGGASAGASAGAGFNLEADFPGLGKN